MVLEYLINSKRAERKPWEMFFMGLIYPSVAIILSLWVFKNYVSFTMIGLTTIATVPLIYNSIKREEKKDILIKQERLRLREHSKVLSYFIFLFLGSIVAFTLWYVYSPPHQIQNIFGLQEETINNFDKNLLGDGIGNYINPNEFLGKIFLNNLKVLLFCLVFSLFFGAGAIYILTLNASIIGTAIGMFIKNNLSYGFLGVFSIGLLRYLTHGIFEIIGYFLGGLAGGIISVAIIRHDFMGRNFKIIIEDSKDLILFALLFLFLGALVEVYVTPIFY